MDLVVRLILLANQCFSRISPLNKDHYDTWFQSCSSHTGIQVYSSPKNRYTGGRRANSVKAPVWKGNAGIIWHMDGIHPPSVDFLKHVQFMCLVKKVFFYCSWILWRSKNGFILPVAQNMISCGWIVKSPNERCCIIQWSNTNLITGSCARLFLSPQIHDSSHAQLNKCTPQHCPICLSYQKLKIQLCLLTFPFIVLYLAHGNKVTHWNMNETTPSMRECLLLTTRRQNNGIKQKTTIKARNIKKTKMF